MNSEFVRKSPNLYYVPSGYLPGKQDSPIVLFPRWIILLLTNSQSTLYIAAVSTDMLHKLAEIRTGYSADTQSENLPLNRKFRWEHGLRY